MTGRIKVESIVWKKGSFNPDTENGEGLFHYRFYFPLQM